MTKEPPIVHLICMNLAYGRPAGGILKVGVNFPAQAGHFVAPVRIDGAYRDFVAWPITEMKGDSVVVDYDREIKSLPEPTVMRLHVG